VYLKNHLMMVKPLILTKFNLSKFNLDSLTSIVKLD